MKKVLLIGVNAKYIHSNPAIYSLHAYTRMQMAEGWEEYLQLAEYTINQNMETILADIYGRKPDVAAFSCYIWNWNMIQELIVELPKVLPDIKIWLGGPEVSFHGEKLLQQYSGVQGIMIGEGEKTFAELFLHYQTGTPSLSSIKGLLLPQGYTGERTLTDINEVPFFYDNLEKFKNRIIYYESQRGCPFRCAYCLSSIDKQVRIRDLDTVKKHLQFFLDNRVDQVKFIDRTFNCNAKYALAVWSYLQEHDNGVTNFHFEIAADLLTEEQLSVMEKMRPGLIQLEIGVQSTNEKTLHVINRYMSLAHLSEMVAKIKGFGNIHQHLDLIAGLPYEDYESFGHSFDDVYAMKPEQLQLGFLKVLKGSPIEEHTQEYGIVYQEKPPYEVLGTNWLSYAEILKLKGVEEMVELYYNSLQFVHSIPVLEKCFTSPFAMYEALADYYKRKGYFVQTPARSYRYQVLLEFMDEVDVTKHDLFAECLTFDLYLRENLKSRPDFMKDMSEKQAVKDFYRQEAERHTYLKDYESYNGVQLAKMTHMECFSYEVWGTGIKLEKPVYLLFDYKHRNPLTYDAQFFVIEENIYE